MTRLRNILIAAAALVGGAVTLPMAFDQANQASGDPYTCEELGDLFLRVDALPRANFWFAYEVGHTIPAVTGSYVLGDCATGACVLATAEEDCDAEASYPYWDSSPTSGWVIRMVDSPLYYGRGWLELGAADSKVRFLKSWKDAETLCLDHFSQADCSSMLNEVNPCWLRTDGLYCRHGKLYGPGQGGTTPCTVQDTDVQYPCSDFGHGPDWAPAVITAIFWGDEGGPPLSDLDLPD